MKAELIVQLLLGGFGFTGLIGAIVALWKVRPEVNSAAVTQSQGAMETMKSLNDELEDALRRTRDELRVAIRDRDEERTLRLTAEAQVRVLERRLQ